MKSYPKYLDWLRYACAWWLYFYGISKIAGHQLQLPASFAQKPLGSLSGYELTWYYFGYSHAYTYILGIIQIVSATLLLFRTSSLIAAMVMLPVMTNIVMINFFYWIGWGPMCTSLFITVALLLILWREREALRELFWNSQKSEARTSRVHRIARSVVLLYAVLTLLASTVGANAFKNFADSYQRQHPNESQSSPRSKQQCFQCVANAKSRTVGNDPAGAVSEPPRKRQTSDNRVYRY